MDMNHRLITIGSTLLCILGLSLPLRAEKPNILVAQHTNVLVNATNGYRANPRGDVVDYSFAVNGDSLLTLIEYNLRKKNGKVIQGRIPAEYFPVDSSTVEFAALERNIALLLFTTRGGTRIYMTFNLVSTDATPRPSKNNIVQHIALDEEVCTLSTSRIISYRYEDDTFAVLHSIRVYNLSWTVTTSKGIDDKYGALSALNPPIQKHYVGVVPEGGPDRYTINILKP
jgi:hypothetical protein